MSTLVLKNDRTLNALVGRALEPIECRRLAYLASQVESDLAIVEIGSYRGKSTCFLASGSKHGNNAHVYAIDLWETGRDRLLNQKGVFRLFLNQLKIADVETLVTPIKGDSREIVKAWSRPIGLLWIDGCHKYKAVKVDYEHWSKFVVKDGWIAFHDYGGNKWPGVKECVENVVKPSELWTDYQLHGSVFSARRL